MAASKAAAAAADFTPEPESAGEDVSIGAQIRQLRKVKGHTLQQLAEAVGISVGYLSQIERDRSRLPIGILKKIADQLGVHMNWFFQPEILGPAEERDIVVRAGRRRKMSFTGTGIVEELLSPDLKGPLELLLSTIEPGADSETYHHDGAEAGFVVSGAIDLWVGARQFRLAAGDSFSFPSTIPHRVANPGDGPARIVWVITPPHY
jgi:transcriptional regulator with XRE-family HTH domain